jgi:hypothetical protein
MSIPSFKLAFDIGAPADEHARRRKPHVAACCALFVNLLHTDKLDLHSGDATAQLARIDRSSKLRSIVR